MEETSPKQGIELLRTGLAGLARDAVVKANQSNGESGRFQSHIIYMITTLLDAVAYPASEIAETYFQRWNVELFFRDIKTTMGMDILRCKSPDMVRKEVLMHLIAYNCIRSLMLEVADKEHVDLQRISFKASVQALRQWEPHLNQVNISNKQRNSLLQLLYESIAGKVIAQRPGRNEPRVVKRRLKAFPLLTRPRQHVEQSMVTDKFNIARP